ASGRRGARRYAPERAVLVRGGGAQPAYSSDGSNPAHQADAEVRPRVSAAPSGDPGRALRVVAAAESRGARAQVPAPARPARLHRGLLLRRGAAGVGLGG